MNYYLNSKVKKSANTSSVKIITDNDLCISCGACTHICPHDNLLMRFNEYRGKWDTSHIDYDVCSKCNGFKNCLSVCPSYSVDYNNIAGASANNNLGRVEKVLNGYSLNKEIRYYASSGGFIREFAKSLLENNIIDSVISLGHNGGMEYTPKAIQDMKDMPTSIYHNVNFEKAFEIIRKIEGKYLIIGLPCQITSIKLLVEKKKFNKLQDRVVLTIALFCGHVMEYNNIEFMANQDNLQLKDIEKVQYRGEGWLEKVIFYSKDNIKKHYLYITKSIQGRLNNRIVYDKFLRQQGCLSCVDHIGYNADIVVGDAWQKSKENNDGENILLFRNKKSLEYLKYLKNFYLEEGMIEDIVVSQKRMFAYGEIANDLNHSTKNKFRPAHKKNIIETDYKVPFYDKLKFKLVKPLLRQKNFFLAKIVYFILWTMEIIDIKLISRK